MNAQKVGVVPTTKSEEQRLDSIHEKQPQFHEDWLPYHDSWLEAPLWGGIFIKIPSNCYKDLPRKFYLTRWLLFSPLRVRVGLKLIGEWSLGELLAFFVLIFYAAIAAIKNFGDAEKSGKLAAIPLILTFSLSSRNSVWTLLLGLPFERAIFWHQTCAWVTVCLGLLHGVGAAQLNKSGIFLEGLMAILCLLTYGPIRRRFWEFFVRTHWILFILVIFAGLRHEAHGIILGILLWGIDLVYRFIYMIHCRNPKQAKIEQLPADVIKISFPKGNFQYKAGQYAFICIPELTLFEWHPFSFSSAPHQEEVSMHIRVLGDWTKRLHEVAGLRDKLSVKLFLEGPYGAPSIDLDGKKYKHILLFSGGIGITPMQSICNDLMYQTKNLGRPLQKVWFIWSVRDKFMVDAVLNFDEKYTKQARLPHSFSPDVLSDLGDAKSPNAPVQQTSFDEIGEGVLVTDFYLTKTREDEHSYANIKPELMPHLNFGRPDFEAIFEAMREIAKVGHKGQKKKAKVAVCVCGPISMVKDISSLCHQLSNGEIQFDFHKELFDF